MKRIQKSGSYKVFEDDQYLIVVPQTEEGSCYYGQGTKWCTSAKRLNQFDTYNEEGTLFYIINKKPKPKTLSNSDGWNGEGGYNVDNSKIVVYVPFYVYEQDLKYLNNPDIELFDARDYELNDEGSLWVDYVDTDEETKLKIAREMVKLFQRRLE